MNNYITLSVNFFNLLLHESKLGIKSGPQITLVKWYSSKSFVKYGSWI